MAQNINRLSAKKVEAIRNQRTARRERIADGGGLYLSVSPNGGHRWVFLYRWRGKPTEIGFGSARDVALARARELAVEARALLAEGRNPNRQMRRSGDRGHAAVLAHRQACWAVGDDVAGLCGPAAFAAGGRVDDISTADVLAVLTPIWNSEPVTANRLRGRIQRVLDAAKAQGLRTGESPHGGAGTWINCCPSASGLHAATMRLCPMPTCRPS